MIYHNDQVSDAETAKILALARASLSVAGDFVEMGCFRGDTSILLAEILRDEEAARGKSLWLYDSFAGLPDKSAADQSALGEAFQAGALTASQREVKARFLRANLKVPHIVKAWFVDLKPDDLPPKIAFAFLDSDLYDSVKTSLALVAPKMSSGGLMLVHDYQNPALPGVTLAVDEFIRAAQAQEISSARASTTMAPQKAPPRLTQFHSLAVLTFVAS